MDIALWSVGTDRLPSRLQPGAPEAEAHLEAWVEQRPELLRDGLLPVARQLVFSNRDRLDLLCLEGQSRWVVVELKRDRMPREVVAQALDYVSQLSSMSTAELRRRLAPHLEKLESTTRQLVEELLSSETDDQPREIGAIVAGVTADSSLLRITDYLSSRFEVPLSVVELRAFRTPTGDLLLAREETGTEAVADEATSRAAAVSLDERWSRVTAAAQQHGFAEALSALRLSVEEAGLFPRPYTRSVMLTPPTHRNRFLAVVGFSGAKARIQYGSAVLQEFYPPLQADAIEGILGPSPRWVGPDEVTTFGRRICELMATLEPPSDQQVSAPGES